MNLSKSTYAPGDTVNITGLIPNSRLQVMKLDQVHRDLIVDQDGATKFSISDEMSGSYLVLGNDEFAAFDVLGSWTERPRYGFVCNFDSEAHPGELLAVELVKFSSNAVQFYDWHYRHEQLVSNENFFVDPLGRKQSHEVVKQMVKQIKMSGIAAMGYVAAYATSNEGAEKNAQWLLYDAKGKPHDFHGFLKITDISRGSEFKNRILSEAANAAEVMGFSGIHFDQYGEPRDGFSLTGEYVDVGESLAELVTDFKKLNRDLPTTLNAVKNWPSEKLATSDQDFYYMELWEESNGRLLDVVRDILGPREMSGNKGLVVAIYIPQANRGSNLIVDSLIHASGGWRIEFGEKDGFLSDPYFPKFETPDQEFLLACKRRNYFAVAMGDLLRSQIPKLLVRHDQNSNYALLDYSTNDQFAMAVVNLGKNSLDSRWGEPLESPKPANLGPISSNLPLGDLSTLTYFSPENPGGQSINILELDGELANSPLHTWGLLIGKRS